MYLDPYAKHDDELIDLLDQAMSPLQPELQKDYLINILTYPPHKNKTIKEMLEAEVKAKKEMGK